MTTPDTTEAAEIAVRNRHAIPSNYVLDLRGIVKDAIAAHNKALEARGYVTIKRGSRPEWMEWRGSYEGDGRVHLYLGHEQTQAGTAFYCINTAEQDGEARG